MVLHPSTVNTLARDHQRTLAAWRERERRIEQAERGASSVDAGHRSPWPGRLTGWTLGLFGWRRHAAVAGSRG
jgi:hypothetical protein